MNVPWRWLFLGVLTGIAGVWIVSQQLPGWLADRPLPPGSTAGALTGDPAAPESRRIHAALFYLADSGEALVAVDAEVAYAPSPAAQARALVDAQLATAPPGRISTIPAGTAVRSIFLTSRGEAFVDLSETVATSHPGGSLSEALTVYAIVHVLTVNLPDVTAVQILIEGREVDTLAGHIDLRHPLTRQPRWIAQ